MSRYKIPEPRDYDIAPPSSALSLTDSDLDGFASLHGSTAAVGDMNSIFILPLCLDAFHSLDLVESIPFLGSDPSQTNYLPSNFDRTPQIFSLESGKYLSDTLPVHDPSGVSKVSDVVRGKSTVSGGVH